MTSDTGLANVAIEQVLELSADAHIERSLTAQDSAERSPPMAKRSQFLSPSNSGKSSTP